MALVLLGHNALPVTFYPTHKMTFVNVACQQCLTEVFQQLVALFIWYKYYDCQLNTENKHVTKSFVQYDTIINY